MTTTQAASTDGLSTSNAVQLGGGFFMFFDGERTSKRSPDTVYGAFRRPGAESDRLAAATARANGLLSDLGGPQPDYANGRLMEGSPQTGVFAVPMSDGTV